MSMLTNQTEMCCRRNQQRRETQDDIIGLKDVETCSVTVCRKKNSNNKGFLRKPLKGKSAL